MVELHWTVTVNDRPVMNSEPSAYVSAKTLPMFLLEKFMANPDTVYMS
jgi:hypothetical protein